VARPNALRPHSAFVGGNRTERPATGRCGLRLPSPLPGAAPNRPRRFRPTKAAVSNCRPCRAPTPLGRVHRPWVEIAQNARQLKVAGFVCKAPCGGCVEPPRWFRSTKGRSFQLPAVSGPNAPRPRPSPVGESRTKRPATGSCGLRLPSSLAGLHRTAPAVLQPKAAVFNCRPLRGPTPPGSARRTEAGSPCQTPGNWTLRASSAKPPPGGCDQPPRRFRIRRPQFPTAGRSGATLPLGRLIPHPSPFGTPWPRPPPVGGNRTERPATGRCGLHLPSPLAGAGRNRPRRFRFTEGRSFQLEAVSAPTPSAAAIARGWKLHRTPGNWKLRASLAKPPHGGYTQPPPAVSLHRRPQFPTAGRIVPHPSGRAGQRPWVETARNARQLKVAGFIYQAPSRGLQLTAAGGFADEGRSFQLPAVSAPQALTPRNHGFEL